MSIDRIPLQIAVMGFASCIATRSTCLRANVGAVITSLDMTQILSFGYNGVARGIPNHCLRDTPGDCGCLHAEENALIKLLTRGPAILFSTMSPCEHCQMRILNSGVVIVYYLHEYRKPLEPWFKKSIRSFNIEQDESLDRGVLEYHLKMYRSGKWPEPL
jgi:deoxycytidylate deaminase